MKSTLFLSYSRQFGDAVQRGITIFIEQNGVSADALDASLSQLLNGQPPMDFVHFVGSQRQVHSVRTALLQIGSMLKDRLNALVKQEAIRFFDFDRVEGRHRCKDLAGDPLADAADQIAAEQRFSLMEIFKTAGGEEHASLGTHYAKTSDSHADRFLRVSNVVEDGQHVALLAFWLLPFVWKPSVRNIAVDTSSIYAVVYKAIQEAAALDGMPNPPQVWSHRSHDGLNDVPDHIFGDALFVVSASTSNGLVRKLAARGVPMQRVLTLFCLAIGGNDDRLDGHKLLCDLSQVGQGDTKVGLAPIVNHRALECPLCAKHYHLIRIQGDQFSISPPRVTPIEIMKKDLDAKLRPLLSALCGRRAFFAYRRISETQVCSVGLDAAKILEGDLHDKSRSEIAKVRDQWASLLRRGQTQSLQHIVSCSYPISEYLANSALESAKASLVEGARVSVIPSHSLSMQPRRACASALVISACVTEPQELLSVSRMLRDVQEGGAIAYVSLAELLPSYDLVKRLRSNITMGQHGPGTFSYNTCLELPLDSIEDSSSWALEKDELSRLRSWLDNNEREVPVGIEDRINLLEGALGAGLVDDLFWPSTDGDSLRLRSDFTLVDRTLEEPKATQADLYAIVCLTLTRLRHLESGPRRLVNSSYERAMLAPATFSRYNDGVLQAAILRAARPKELAYGACDGSLSEDMLFILLDMLPGQLASAKSEALREFLIAMMIGRMTLRMEHQNKFLNRLIEVAEAKSVERTMGEYLLMRSG